MENLKERERAILAYMKEEIKKKGYPPTVREICQALNIKSTSTAHKDIDSLVKQGYIVKDPSKPRALMLKDTSFYSDDIDSVPKNPQGMINP
ncbi:MAG: HTH domain-containing protein, partial [Firmicutes bacterium]|nr:HTH domain-containing protein [Bacillota bacterium]